MKIQPPRNFCGFRTSEQYAVGCTGCTGVAVYVYDGHGNELAQFKDIKYARAPMFFPGQNKFIVKSTDGRLAVYSLETMQLLQKFRFSKIDGSQDDGFCFSEDGKYFYNIERHIESYHSCLSIYETSDFRRIKQLFLSDNFELKYIEFDATRKGLFVLGFMRNETRVFDYGFVAALENDILLNVTKLSRKKYDRICSYKNRELSGFPPRGKEWTDDWEYPNLSAFVVAK
jgi:hypothetical protein